MAELSKNRKKLIICGLITLVAVLVICLAIYVPRWQRDSSRVSLDFYPKAKDTQSTLISINHSERASYLSWSNRLRDVLDGYYRVSKTQHIITCSYHNPPTNGSVCDIDVRDWGECNVDHYFGYYKAAPCIFLKLITPDGWSPEFYESENDLPGDMPRQLRTHVLEVFAKRTYAKHTVWVSCEGETPADKEYLGEIKYYPSEIQGFPGYYFPYLNNKGFLSPLVAVQFNRPKSGVLMNVECRAWAKNIVYNKEDGTGLIHFEIMIE